jgi:23S rRNA (uracil1939-C5)-methyltransferase
MQNAVLVSPEHRVAPACRHFGVCGGCDWQHVAYAEQLRLKQRRLQALVDTSLGPRAPRVAPTRPTPFDAGAADAPWGYRGKVHFVFGPGGRGAPLVMGHFRRGSRAVVPVDECPVHAAAGNRWGFAIRDALLKARVAGATPDGDQGTARHVVVRVAEGTGEILATLVVTDNVKALRRVTDDVRARMEPAAPGERPVRAGFHLNVHDRPGVLLFGRETRRLFGLAEAREQVGAAQYLISPTSFFQTNVRAAKVLVDLVLDAAPGPGARVLDLYAGVGLFALPLAMRGSAVTAVEENRDAVAAASAALRLNRVPDRSCRLVASRVEDAMSRLGTGASAGRRGAAWDTVVLDPPRQGCPPRVLTWIVDELRPERIVYVSCNPEALAADLAAIPPGRYAIDRVVPVDMFPHTEHIEAVAVLGRG